MVDRFLTFITNIQFKKNEFATQPFHQPNLFSSISSFYKLKQLIMKTQSLVLRFLLTFTIGVAFIVMVMLVFSSCKNEQSGVSGTLQLKANSNQLLKSATIASVNGASISLDAAKVEIRNLRIEENSGNDNQNQSGDQSGNDGNEKNSKSEAGDAGDILLSGPYLLDILSGTASIDQVTVQPGTYKKVDFEFYCRI